MSNETRDNKRGGSLIERVRGVVQDFGTRAKQRVNGLNTGRKGVASDRGTRDADSKDDGPVEDRTDQQAAVEAEAKSSTDFDETGR